MSLNGLDNVEVAEAYRTSLGEAGGWFLLKYTSRDSVEILKRGAGGVSEAKTTIAEYEDPSPLYGFLLYRRRKVLLKYVPESTSRLLKARMHVHFEHIQERFSPWDTVFDLTTADELTDSALGSACALHTASSPTRNKKLSGITEYTETDEGDGTENKARDEDEKIEEKREDQAQETDTDTDEDKAKDKAKDEEKEKQEKDKGKERSKGKSKSSHTRYRSMVDQAIEEGRPSTSSSIKTSKDQEGASTSLSRSATNASNYSQATIDAAPSYAASIHSTKTYDYHAADRRMSTQTLRPATSDIYAGMYSYKPKVKLGPRPSLDASKRPHTTGSASSPQVATLPAGMRASRKTQTPQSYRPQSRDSTKSAFSSTIGPAPPIPHAPRTPSIITRPTSSHSTKTTLSTSGISPTTPRITPEKQRLMKAVELRKRQQQAAREKAKKNEASAEATSAPAETPNQDQEPPSPKKIPVSENTEPENVEPKNVEPRKEVVVDTSPEKSTPTTSTDQTASEASADPEDVKVDSAVEIVVTEKADNDTDDTRSITLESSPTSMKDPSTPSSTRPSSLSDAEEQKVIPTPTRAVDAREDVRGSDTTIQGKLDDAMAQEQPSSDDSESTEDKDDSTPTQETIHSSTPDIKIEAAEPDVQEGQPKLDTKPSEETVETLPSRPQTMINISSDGPNTKEELPADEIKLPDRSLDEVKEDVEIDTPTSNKEGPLKAGPGLDQPLGQKPSNLREKRQASIEPIHTDADHSDADYLSDDSFMEELQSAKVQEAKPVSVSKSPMSPFFNRPASARSFSNPSGLSPAPPSLHEGGRSVSATYVGTAKSPGDQIVVPKKINVSSGISQRIKALTEKGAKRDSIASQHSTLTPDGNSIVNMRKASLRTPPSRSPSSGSRVGPVASKRNSLSSRQSSPELIRHSSNVSQSTPEVPPVYTVQDHDGPSESVSVTARIIRDSKDQPPSRNVTPETPLELHQSPLTINHSRGTRSSVSLSNTMAPPPQPIRAHSDTKAPTVTSNNGTRESSAPNSRSSIDSTWRSMRRPSLQSRNRSSTSLHTDDGSLNSPVEEGGSKKSNRASRLLKRMSSSLSSASRKSLSQMSSPTREDVSTPVRELATVPEPPAGTQLGDLNVQFPDTLLWKWRWVEIDGQGNMVLQAPKSERTPQKGQAYTRKYHLNEFNLPYAPDQDRQEMPNSIILDFTDGRTLQCACEDAMDQARVLNLLQDCHRAWTSYQH